MQDGGNKRPNSPSREGRTLPVSMECKLHADILLPGDFEGPVPEQRR
jgi:hypothetical protein